MPQPWCPIRASSGKSHIFKAVRKRRHANLQWPLPSAMKMVGRKLRGRVGGVPSGDEPLLKGKAPSTYEIPPPHQASSPTKPKVDAFAAWCVTTRSLAAVTPSSASSASPSATGQVAVSSGLRSAAQPCHRREFNRRCPFHAKPHSSHCYAKLRLGPRCAELHRSFPYAKLPSSH